MGRIRYMSVCFLDRMEQVHFHSRAFVHVQCTPQRVCTLAGKMLSEIKFILV